MKITSDKEDVVKDAMRRVTEAKIRKESRLYFNASGEERIECQKSLIELMHAFLKYGGTVDQFDLLLNEE